MEEYEGCPPRTSLDVLRRETRAQMRVHLQKPWSNFLDIFYSVLQPYIAEGFDYAYCVKCKKAVQVELDLMKSICCHVDIELEKLKSHFEDAARLCSRARKELHTMDGIEGLLKSDDIFIPPDTCGWLVDLQMNPKRVKAYLDYLKREESELKYRHPMEEGQLEDQKERDENQLKDQTQGEENEREYPEAMKERVMFLIEQLHSVFLATSHMKDIKSNMSSFREHSMALYRLLKERLERLSNHECQDKEAEQSTRPLKKRWLLQQTDNKTYSEEEVPFFADGKMCRMII